MNKQQIQMHKPYINAEQNIAELSLKSILIAIVLTIILAMSALVSLIISTLDSS